MQLRCVKSRLCGGCVDARDEVRVSRRRDNLDSELKVSRSVADLCENPMGIQKSDRIADAADYGY